MTPATMDRIDVPIDQIHIWVVRMLHMKVAESKDR